MGCIRKNRIHCIVSFYEATATLYFCNYSSLSLLDFFTLQKLSETMKDI